MNFHLSEEDLMIKKLAKDFAEKEIQPVANDLNEKGEFPVKLYQQMGELGLVSVPYPEEHGGVGGSWLQFAIVHEELSRIDSGVANAIMGNSSVCTLITAFGSPEQKEKWLPQIYTGKKIGAIALTEPNAGSDANNLKTTATLEGDEWVINGAKTFISNSGTEITDPIIVSAVTGKADNGRNKVGTFIVPKATPGLIVSPPLKKVGWHSNDTRELTFEECRIPKKNLLGDQAKGYRQALQTVSAGRFLIAAMGLGVAQGSLDLSLQYVHEREAFGQHLKDFQNIQFKLAEMATKVELARLMIYKAASLKDQDLPFAKEASMAKMYATQTAMEVSREAVQMHGGYGITREYDVSRHFNAAKILEIVEGTNEIQKIIISRSLYKDFR